MTQKINITKTLEQLHDIADWFEQQTQVDVEEGLKRVKEAAILIKVSKARLKEIENEFVEIKADIQETEMQDNTLEEGSSKDINEKDIVVKPHMDSSIALDDLPF